MRLHHTPSSGSGAFPYENTPLQRLLDGSLHPGGRELTRHALEIAAIAPGDRVLDLGCGPGVTLSCLATHGCATVGLDRSFRLLETATTHAACLCADMAHIPLQKGVMDAVVCECVLSVSEDKAGVLRECARILRPQGKLILSDVIIGPEEPETGRPPLPCLTGAASRSVMRQLLEENGFRITAEEDHTPYLRALAARIVWEYGSLEHFFSLWTIGDAGQDTCGCSGNSNFFKKYTYTLIIAKKVENTYEADSD